MEREGNQRLNATATIEAKIKNENYIGVWGEVLTPEGGFKIGAATENRGWSALSVCIIAYNANGLQERRSLSRLALVQIGGSGSGSGCFAFPLYLGLFG